jgi:hypothetical protein
VSAIQAATLDFRKGSIVDWYDGVLSALVDFGDREPSHLCLAIAWSPEYDVRVYGLVPITKELADTLRKCLARDYASIESWSEITALMAKGQTAYSGPVLVVAVEQSGSRILGRMEVPSEQIPELGLHTNRAEATDSNHRLRHWLDRLGLPMPPDYKEQERLRFGRFLEMTGPGWETRAARLDVTPAEREALIAEFSGQLLGIGTPGTKIFSWIGEPHEYDSTIRSCFGRSANLRIDQDGGRSRSGCIQG